MYGVDFDQHRVPAYPLFHLDYLISDGDIVRAALSDDLQAFHCYAFVDMKIQQAKEQNEQARAQ